MKSLQVLIESVSERIDEQREDSLRMHHENREELRAIRAQTTATNGRLSIAETNISTLFRTAPKEAITFGTAKRYAAFGGYVIAGVLWLLHMMGKL
jgi:hypothetical protein